MCKTSCLFEQAILVNVVFTKNKDDAVWNLKEFLSLAFSAEIQILDIVTSNCVTFNSRYLIGTGKLLELEKKIKDYTVSTVLFSHNLLPHQERNLTCFLKCKIIDRNQLIYNIFSQRACTYSGKLQVKLAQLRYLNSRLIHEWSHLERQKGGISIRGGPGEMQLESDRRLIRKQITQILLRLKKIENQREQNRQRRIKTGIPIISLVGYANAGKSTLFNVMTNSNVYTAKKLFSTLDPTCRRIIYKKEFDAMLIDTVGFIKNLPKDLISSFRATLQETIQSTLLLHVVDITNVRFEQDIDAVQDILNNIKITNIPTLLVMNKIDRLKTVIPCIDRNDRGYPVRVWISAKNRIGISLLMQAVNELLPNNDVVCHELRIPIDDSLYQKLYQMQVIQKYSVENDNSIRLTIKLSSLNWYRLLKNSKSLLNYIV